MSAISNILLSPSSFKILPSHASRKVMKLINLHQKSIFHRGKEEPFVAGDIKTVNYFAFVSRFAACAEQTLILSRNDVNDRTLSRENKGCVSL